MNQSQHRTSLIRRENATKSFRAAAIVETFGWIVGATSPLVGIVVAFQESEDESGDPARPFALLGLGIGVAGFVYAAAVVMVGTYIKWRVADDVIVQNSQRRGEDPAYERGY